MGSVSSTIGQGQWFIHCCNGYSLTFSEEQFSLISPILTWTKGLWNRKGECKGGSFRKMFSSLTHTVKYKCIEDFLKKICWLKGLSQLKLYRGVNVCARLLKPMTFLGTLGFCKRCLESWYLWLGTKICLCFFGMCFAIYSFLLESFSTHLT